MISYWGSIVPKKSFKELRDLAKRNRSNTYEYQWVLDGGLARSKYLTKEEAERLISEGWVKDMCSKRERKEIDE